MRAKNNEIRSYSAILDKKYGVQGSPSRLEAEQKAYSFYTGLLIEEARKEAKMTQEELAKKIGSNKSYISKVENGKTEPKVSTFYRIAAALGLAVDLRPLHP
ncbi:helix-turn-helix transcriptional regulator [Parabacteroides sp. PF5-6]|uniref:helix-turn-helix domain-containing protein n=1 Tax=Parabacteroides sp. PF5-6 TaxID=1742403 RepID=UPI002405CA43|nr:helix-turn-helix transcriptional regulator [Parabacteroides sp. PF5-6]MDF9831133.1 DNA-binding XRE family transcriptional regulator [Parabacteroides sp. PF5-6]